MTKMSTNPPAYQRYPRGTPGKSAFIPENRVFWDNATIKIKDGGVINANDPTRMVVIASVIGIALFFVMRAKRG